MECLPSLCWRNFSLTVIAIFSLSMAMALAMVGLSISDASLMVPPIRRANPGMGLREDLGSQTSCSVYGRFALAAGPPAPAPVELAVAGQSQA